MDPQGIVGMAQGPSGVTQGAQGAMEAAKNGPTNSAMSSTGERKSMGLFSFLAPLAGIASEIPGPWQPFAAGASALLGGISGSQQQAQAAKAQQAAQAGQAGAMAGQAGIAGNLNAPPDYASTLKAENQGINTLKANMGGVANPGALIKDLQGQNIQNAIEGDNADAAKRQEAAAGILGGLGREYGGIETQAGAASTAGGNPFGGLLQSIPGMIGGGKGSSDEISPMASGITPGQPTAFTSPLPGGPSGTLAPPTPANPFAGR